MGHQSRTSCRTRIEIVDPLEPDRIVGKTYIYPAAGGWEVSGYYRRDNSDAWHPYLVTLDGSFALTHIKVADGQLLPLADDDQAIEVLP